MGEVIVKIHTKRPNEATPENAAKFYNDGMSINSLAKAWEVSPATIYYLLHKAGVETPRKRTKHKTPTPATINAIILPKRKRPDLIITEA